MKRAERSDEQGAFGKRLPERDSYPPADLGLTIAIVLTARRWRSLIDEKLRQLGHSASRMEAMAAIAYSSEAATQIQIAKRIGIEGPTLTRTLDMLEADGLVERLPDPADRRNKRTKLTPAGFEALADMFALMAGLRGQLLDGIPEADIAHNLDFLSLLLGRIEAGFPLSEKG